MTLLVGQLAPTPHSPTIARVLLPVWVFAPFKKGRYFWHFQRTLPATPCGEIGHVSLVWIDSSSSIRPVWKHIWRFATCSFGPRRPVQAMTRIRMMTDYDTGTDDDTSADDSDDDLNVDSDGESDDENTD